MAGNIRIYYDYQNTEHTLDVWSDANSPLKSDPEVINAVLAELPEHAAPSIKRVVELTTDGKPMIYDVFRIEDPDTGLPYGLLYTRLGHDGWVYLSDIKSYGERIGKELQGEHFTMVKGHNYATNDKKLFPANAKVDWERLSVFCNEHEYHLIPWSPSS
ncbi:TPA: hypothetical protein MFG77_001600 [Klebsiella pneumoniae]|nr:hypothetical protein [Klebsiella pneumoniae]